MPVSIDDLRRYAVTRSLFAPTTLFRAVTRLGFVQADPIAAPARAQDLILRHRVKNYREGDLERRYPKLALEEDFVHVYGYLPRSARALLHPRGREWAVEREYPGLARQVLKLLRAQGEVDHRDLEQALGKMHTQGNWGGQAKATTKILDLLHVRGQARVARRAGSLRRYAPAVPPKAELPPKERLRKLMLLIVGLYAPISARTLRELASRLRFSVPSLQGRRIAIDALAKEGDLASAEVDGMAYYWPGGERIPANGDAPEAVRWLAPFDPVVWDRTRFEHIWGWPYRFEAYTKPHKRKWGFYALPMLWRDRVIGWANAAVAGGRLQVSLGYVDGQPNGRAFKRALEEERARLEAFLDL
jgi:uncharacterized protein